MLLLMLAAPALGAASSGFLHLDPMDRYINEANGMSSGSQDEDPFATPAAEHTTPKSEDSSSSSGGNSAGVNSIEAAFKAMDDFSSPSAQKTSPVEDTPAPAHEFDAMDRVARDANSMPSSFATAPAQKEAESAPAAEQQPAAPLVEQAQPEEAQPTGQVFDVTLSSELQQSLLQKHAKQTKQNGGKKNAPDVEAAVAKEKAFDVYIHDGFGEMEKKDIKDEKAVKANKDLKA